MMAKMFYTMEEAKSALAKSEDEIKQYAREGRLREFRDGPRLMFKADQVEQLKGELSGGGMGELDQVDLGVSDSGGLIGLVDTTGASGTSITLSDADTGQSPGGGGALGGTAGGSVLGLAGSTAGGSGLAGSGLGGSGLAGSSSAGSGMIGLAGGSVAGGPPPLSSAGSTAGGVRMKDDTALAADLGLSGSLGGVPSPGRSGGGTGSGLSGSVGGRSGAGINVFGADDSGERVDPSAQTAISGGIRDQIDLQGVGSGSGLLDLTRESDDTSLGAVLDEITPAGTASGRRPPAFDSAAGTGVGEGSFGMGMGMGGPMTDEAPPPRVAAPPVYIQQADSLAPAFGGAALAAAGVCVFGAFVLISSLVGTRPEAVQWFKTQSPFIAVAMGLGITLVFFVFGLIFGKLGKR